MKNRFNRAINILKTKIGNLESELRWERHFYHDANERTKRYRAMWIQQSIALNEMRDKEGERTRRSRELNAAWNHDYGQTTEGC